MVMKSREGEDERSALPELENKNKTEEERQKKRDEKRKRQARVLHWMKCPKCGMDLIEIDYKHIKVDKCSHCDGIWFDVGEIAAMVKMDKTGLDKLFSDFKKLSSMQRRP